MPFWADAYDDILIDEVAGVEVYRSDLTGLGWGGLRGSSGTFGMGVYSSSELRGDPDLDALDVEAKQQDVAVLDHVMPTLASHQALLAGHLVRPRLHELVEPYRLGADEAALKVRVDLARGVERGIATVHRPGAHLGLAHREKRLQAE